MNVLELSVGLQCDLIRALSPESSTSEMLTTVADRVAEELEADACSIYTVDRAGDSATQQAGTGYQAKFVNQVQCWVVSAKSVPEAPREEEKLGLTGWILSTGKSFLARSHEELASHPHRMGIHDVKQLPDADLRLETFLGVPLRGLRGEVIGLVKAERLEKPGEPTRPFSVRNQILLETAARVASKCLAYLDLARGGELSEAITAWTRDAIGEAAASEGELDTFLTSVANVVAAAMRADSCGVYFIADSKKTLTQRAGCGSQEPRLVIRSYLLPSKEQIEAGEERVGLTAWIAATGESFYASSFEELSNHPHHQGQFDHWNFPKESETECGAFLGVPLQLGGTITGVVKVENISRKGVPDPRRFPEDARRRFDLLAQDVALAIVRLQEERIPARYEVITKAQKTIFDILRGGLDVRSLVEKVVSDTQHLFNARACALFLKEGNRLIQPHWAARGWATRGPEVREYELVEPQQIKDDPEQGQKVGLTVWIAVKQKEYTAHSNLELKLHPHHRGKYDRVNFVPRERCESFMGKPLIVGDKLVGVLKVETKQKVEKDEPPTGQDYRKPVTYFSEQDELVFDLIANSAAIAIENARMLEAERLADQIRNQPAHLLIDLHDFITDHLWAVETLNQAGNSLRRDKPDIAWIVEEYAKLLGRAPTPVSLTSFIGKIKQHSDFLQASRELEMLYSAFVEALRVKSLAQISGLGVSGDAVAELELIDRFFLSDTVKLFRDLCTRVSTQGRGPGGWTDRAALDQARVELKTMKESAKSQAQPERDIIAQIAELWLELIDNEAPPFRTVDPNPYVVGPPIQPKPGNAFFGRHDVFDWVAKNIKGENQPNTLVLYGERRMGKTSILLQLDRGELGRKLREQGDPLLCPVWVDLLSLADPSMPKFLHVLMKAIRDSMNRHPAVGQAPPVPPLSDIEKASDCFNDYMQQVDELLAPVLLAVMVDEFEKLSAWVARDKMSTEVFGLLRHQIQSLSNVAFILAGTHLLEEVSTDGLSLVFAMARHREVGFMSDEEASLLVREPVARWVDYDQAAVDELLRVTHGHPYLLQVLCSELIETMNKNKESNKITHADVGGVIEGLTPYSAMTYLHHAFPELSSTDQNLLMTIAQIAWGDRLSCSAEAIAQRLARPTQDIAGHLPHLLRHRLIEEELPAEGPPTESLYRPTIPLITTWLLLHA